MNQKLDDTSIFGWVCIVALAMYFALILWGAFPTDGPRVPYTLTD